MEWLITVLVFIGYMCAFLLCVAAVVGGIYLAATVYKSRHQIVDEATLEHPKSGWKIYFKGTGGILLAIAGIVGCCFIVYHYWQVMLILFLLAGGGGETARRNRKRKLAKSKTSKRQVAAKKTPKKKKARKRYSRN